MLDALARVNTFRQAARRSDEWSDAETKLDSIFRASSHLAVYGTLAPGGPNEHVRSSLRGTWHDGVVHGELHVQSASARLDDRRKESP